MPAMQPPLGVQSNFDNPRTDGRVLVIVGTVFTVIPFIAVILRLYVRKVVSSQKILWDDDLDYGLGKHMWDIRALSVTHQRLVSLLVMDDVITAAAYLTRISILLLYYRLFQVYDTSCRLVCIGMTACTLITIPYLGVIITRAVRCTEPTAILTNTFCHTNTISIAVVTFAGLNMITDFFILLIPIHRFWSLNVSKKKKMGLIAIFAAGFLACAFAVVRLIWVCIHFSDKDTLRYALWVGLFAILEVNIALTSNCAIFFPAVWKARKSVFSISSRRRHGVSGYDMNSRDYASEHKSKEPGARGNSREISKSIIQHKTRGMEFDDDIIQQLEVSEQSRR
ncbi:uncharacterized protein BDR25DRAFT_365656 [Lindgomyces ingoldianus]|uniref:Uncharacterized protein n=1 Tax=Lindgomyces ingoldianus TaxID=673940 RepID=A0ACB6RI57_9PLEO|nr:uncharacterized protein BDR25DRAFT_365656 [Lindgomyces ingoldianus]KAF2478405.1 hypothetical protein BDR25DRAFT_365656 [Lindgomyces ingoldianus]